MHLKNAFETHGELLNGGRGGRLGTVDEKGSATDDGRRDLRILRHKTAGRHFDVEKRPGGFLDSLCDQVRLGGGITLIDEHFQARNVAA